MVLQDQAAACAWSWPHVLAICCVRSEKSRAFFEQHPCWVLFADLVQMCCMQIQPSLSSLILEKKTGVGGRGGGLYCHFVVLKNLVSSYFCFHQGDAQCVFSQLFHSYATLWLGQHNKLAQ